MKLNESNIFNKSSKNIIDYGSNNFNQNTIQKTKNRINFFQNQKENKNNLLIDENNNNNILNILKNNNVNQINKNNKKNHNNFIKNDFGDRFIPLRYNTSEHQLLYLDINNNNNKNININNNYLINTELQKNKENYIKNNIILDSILIKKDSLIESVDMNINLENKNRLLSFTKNTQNNENIIKRKNSNPISRKKSTNTITDIKYLYKKNINDYNKLQNEDNELYITRNIQLEPERILDAPNLIDDYYLNLLDWGSLNTLSICLSNNVYLWNNTNCNTSLLTTDNDNYSSISFMNNNGSCLALGKGNGTTEIWDIEKFNKIRTLEGHDGRVTSLAWNGYLLSSAGKDSIILNHDVRIKEHKVNKMINGHNKEICNLKWDGEFNYLASGGNDNMVCVWDIKKTNSNFKNNTIWSILNSPNREKENNDINPLYIFNNHIAAVKAISWSPYKRNLLISGGGKKDNSIKFWNIDEGKLINSFDTGSQVCQLLWNKYEKEIISSHGYNKNSINIWTYPKMYKVAELTGHMNRVLYMCISPDDITLASGASDETLRFWTINDREKVNEMIKKKNSNNEFEFDEQFANMNIR